LSEKKKKVFIDGQEGTTGLEIASRLKNRTDIELLQIDPLLRKDTKERTRFINNSDITILCLPDAAAVSAIELADVSKVKILDASTAHRVNSEWVYGFPELKPGFRERIAQARLVANPGCYATGFISLIKPLLDEGVLPRDFPAAAHAVSGYSGGGKKLIESYSSSPSLSAENCYHYAPYQLDLRHKHLPEMRIISGLSADPVFMPAVDHFYRGMAVFIPVHKYFLNQYKKRTDDVFAAMKNYYSGEKFIQVMQCDTIGLRDQKFLDIRACNNTNRIDITVAGSADGACVLCARLDNLGKGASGAAVQNMNLMLGLDEFTGLNEAGEII